MKEPLDDALTSPWALSRSCSVTSEATRVANRLFARRTRRRLTADVRAALDPRSLDPGRSFWSAFAELIWDLTSPADFCNECCMRALSPDSHDPRWDGRRDALPFLTCHAASLARAVTRGEPRSIRSRRPRCRFLLVIQVCPTAMPTRPRHPRRVLTGEVAVAIVEARVRGPNEGRVIDRSARR